MIGLDIGSASIKAVELQKKEGFLSLTGFAIRNTAGGGGPPLAADIQATLSQAKIGSRQAALSVGGPLVAVRVVELPEMTDKELKMQ